MMPVAAQTVAIVVLTLWLAGCAEPTGPQPSKPATAAARSAPSKLPKRPAAAKSTLKQTAPTAPSEDGAAIRARESAAPTVSEAQGPSKRGAIAGPPPVDEDRVASQGIRKVTGERLTLYTDLPVDADLDRLPELCDQAYRQWCAYFDRIELAESAWALRGYLMKDEAKFTAAGLLPDDLPAFANGYARGLEVWCRDQETPYYRRHLVLHEATHAFMFAAFGTCGPPWYMEGMAELLGTHSLIDGRLTLGAFPAAPDDVPGWGRIRMVREAVAAGRSLAVDDILAYTDDAYLVNEPYAWCWALAAFLDGHPRYRDRFRQLPGELKVGDFNRRVRQLFAADWPELNDEWRVFVHDLDFGYDLARSAIDFAAGEPLAGKQTVTVRTDRGWQASGVRLAAGKTYRLTASGRYQVARQPRPWWCEPGGVTIRYVDGRPLGMLLAAIVPEEISPEAAEGFLSPVAVGLGATLTPAESGTLYLRINDRSSGLADNAGALETTIEAP